MTHARRTQIQILTTLITAWMLAFCAQIAYGQVYYIQSADEGAAGRTALIATEPVGDYTLHIASEDFRPVLRGTGGAVAIEDGWGESDDPIYIEGFRDEPAYWRGRTFAVTDRPATRYLGSVETAEMGARKSILISEDAGRIRPIYHDPAFVHYQDTDIYYGPPREWVQRYAFPVSAGLPGGFVEITPVRVTYQLLDDSTVTVSRDLMDSVPLIGHTPDERRFRHHQTQSVGLAMDLAGVSTYPAHLTDHPNVAVLDEIMTAWAAQEDSLDAVIDDLIALADFRASEIARLEDELADAQAALAPLQAEVAALQAEAEDRAARDAARVARILQALGR